MTSCPRDKHGKLHCEIIDHPDRDNQTFCNYCKRRFSESSNDFDGVWAVICVLFILLLVLILAGCSKQSTKLLLIRIADSSASALNNSQQVKASKDTCFGLADGAKQGDQQGLIEVSQEMIATDPAMIKDSNDSYALCHQKTESKGHGTYVCPALDLAVEMSDRHPETPIIVLQMETSIPF